jgi:predicted short-subunit dehydrogenase-like oxidoreductase (DUF2520 family)
MSEISKTARLVRRPQGSERVLVVGDGPVGRAFATALERAGAKVVSWSRRQGGVLPAADVVLLAVRDEAVGEMAEKVMQSVASDGSLPVLLHCAGALGPDEPFKGLKRKPLGAGLCHPLRSLAGATDDADLFGTVFAVAGDEPGRAAALQLVRYVGGTPLELEAAQLPRYHAAAALVSNHAVALVDAAVELLTSVGLERAQAVWALGELLGSTATNLRTVGLPEALTGPISRGDVDTVARHLLALAQHKGVAALYRSTGHRVTKVAAEKGRATPESLERIRALLGPILDGD